VGSIIGPNISVNLKYIHIMAVASVTLFNKAFVTQMLLGDFYIFLVISVVVFSLITKIKTFSYSPQFLSNTRIWIAYNLDWNRKWEGPAACSSSAL
jgi:hypothetical protein